MAESTDWISRLNGIAAVDDLDGAVTRLFLLPIVAFFVQAANVVEAIFSLIGDPLLALGTGIGGILDSITGGASEIINAGAAASATDVSIFGLFGFPLGLGIALGGGLVLAWYLGREVTSDTIPFTFTDLPLVGVDEDNEEA